VPVEVVAAPRERLPDQIESAAYFVVSECLANVGKHANATRATVSVTTEAGDLVVVVSDDGVGGAELGNGSGLQGLEDRAGALDGKLSLDSPPGGGTRVRVGIPLVEPAPVCDEDVARPVLSDEQAARVDARRRRRLFGRLTFACIVAFVIVAVWALTGAPNAWPVWPLLSLAFVAALDAWRVRMTAPTRESDLTGGDYQALRRGRRVLKAAGTLAILNVFLFGIWIAAGAGYFWPAWVLLGSAVALALKAMPWHSHGGAERLHGTRLT
jgi:hypothetical protein